MYFGPEDGDSAASMFEDLAYLFEQAAADGTPIRAVVGEDPVEFAEAFLLNYSKGGWVTRERERLVNAIGRAEGEDGGPAHDSPAPAIRVQGSGEVLQAAGGAARRGLRRVAGQHFRPARLERGGQDHGREDPVHAAQGQRGDCRRQRLRCRHAGCGRSGVHQPHRTVRGRRRNPRRAGEPRAGRPVATAQGPGPGRG
jgi:hypothetical protein